MLGPYIFKYTNLYIENLYKLMLRQYNKRAHQTVYQNRVVISAR